MFRAGACEQIALGGGELRRNVVRQPSGCSLAAPTLELAIANNVLEATTTCRAHLGRLDRDRCGG
jgi:hypothetical protein